MSLCIQQTRKIVCCIIERTCSCMNIHIFAICMILMLNQFWMDNYFLAYI